MSLLEGIKVVDFSKWLPGQYCGMLLGDYGADVIKIEDLAGKGTGHELLALNAEPQ